MRYPEFKLESYLAEREFIAPFNLCASDLETHAMSEIVQMADEECLKIWNALELHYTETKGHPLLRKEISKLYGQHIDKEHVLCFAGAEEGVYSMAHTLLEPSDHVIVVTPCYQSLESLPDTLCSTTKISLEHQKGWELDVSEIANAIRDNTKLLIINFPHNPTGVLISQETQNALIDLARQNDIWIFSDEVYRLLEIDPTDRLPPIASVYEKGLSLSVMSKAYGLPGLRIGWIACQDLEILEKMNETKHYLSICNSGPSEVLSLIALRASEKICARNASMMNQNLVKLDHFFEKYGEWFDWVRPKGGCIGYPLFKGKIPIDQLAEALLKQSGVLILPGSIYGETNNHFRISFGRKSMPEALEKLMQFIEKNSPNWRKK